MHLTCVAFVLAIDLISPSIAATQAWCNSSTTCNTSTSRQYCETTLEVNETAWMGVCTDCGLCNTAGHAGDNTVESTSCFSICHQDDVDTRATTRSVLQEQQTQDYEVYNNTYSDPKNDNEMLQIVVPLVAFLLFFSFVLCAIYRPIDCTELWHDLKRECCMWCCVWLRGRRRLPTIDRDAERLRFEERVFERNQNQLNELLGRPASHEPHREEAEDVIEMQPVVNFENFNNFNNHDHHNLDDHHEMVNLNAFVVAQAHANTEGASSQHNDNDDNNDNNANDYEAGDDNDNNDNNNNDNNNTNNDNDNDTDDDTDDTTTTNNNNNNNNGGKQRNRDTVFASSNVNVDKNDEVYNRGVDVYNSDAPPPGWLPMPDSADTDVEEEEEYLPPSPPPPPRDAESVV